MAKKAFRPKPDPDNARVHNDANARLIRRSLEDVGGGRSILVDGEGRVRAGNATYKEALALGMTIKPVEAGPNELIAVVRKDLTGARAERAGIYDNAASDLSEWDRARLKQIAEAQAEALQAIRTKEGGTLAELAAKEKQALASLGDDAGDGEAGAPEGESDAPERETLDIDDVLYPSDNDLGIPTLDLKMQATGVVLPVVRWGRLPRRGAVMSGTWHFYTEDYRFNALWADPSPVPLTKCRAAVEPNWSIVANMPRAVAIYRMYQKRWVSRFWQDCGVKIFVDLWIGGQYDDLLLLGVPSGWRAYACRGTEQVDEIDALARQARKRAGVKKDSDLCMLIYGGGARWKTECKKRGWVWCAEELHEVDGRYEDNGDGQAEAVAEAGEG